METFTFATFVCFLILAAVIFLAFISLAIYFIPIIIAFIRKHNNFFAICLLNIFTGWTFLGWLASLLWALNSDIEKYHNEDDDEDDEE